MAEDDPAWTNEKRVSNRAANEALAKCLPVAVKQIVDGGGVTAQLFQKMGLEDYCRQKLLLPFTCMDFVPQNIELAAKYFERKFNKLYDTTEWYDDGDKNTSTQEADFNLVGMFNYIGENCLSTDRRQITDEQRAAIQKECDDLQLRCQQRYVYGAEGDDIDPKLKETREAFVAELDTVREKRKIAKEAMDTYVMEANGFDDTFVSMKKDLKMWDDRLRMGIEIMSQGGDDIKELFAQLKKKRDEMRSPMEKILNELSLASSCFPQNSLPVKSFVNADNELVGWEEVDEGVNPMPVSVGSPEESPESLESQQGLMAVKIDNAKQELETKRSQRGEIEGKQWPYRRKRREERRLDSEIYTLEKRIDRLTETMATLDEMIRNAEATQMKIQAEMARLKAKQQQFEEMYKSLVEDTTGIYKPVWTITGEGPKGAWRIEYESKDNVKVDVEDEQTVNTQKTQTTASVKYGGFWGSVGITAAVGTENMQSRGTSKQEQDSDRSRFYFEWHRSELMREDIWDDAKKALRSPMVYFDMTRDSLSDVQKMTPGWLNEAKGAKWLPHTVVFCQKVAVWDYAMASTLETASQKDSSSTTVSVDVNVDTMWGLSAGFGHSNTKGTENQRNQAKMKANQEFKSVTIGNPIVAFLLLEHIPFFPIRITEDQNLAGEIGPDYFPMPDLKSK